MAAPRAWGVSCWGNNLWLLGVPTSFTRYPRRGRASQHCREACASACPSKSGSLAAVSSWSRQSREENNGHCGHPRLPWCPKPTIREISLGKGSELTMGSLRDFFFSFKLIYILLNAKKKNKTKPLRLPLLIFLSILPQRGWLSNLPQNTQVLNGRARMWIHDSISHSPHLVPYKTLLPVGGKCLLSLSGHPLWT